MSSDATVASEELQPKPLLVNIEKAAELLAVGRSTLYQLIWTEELIPIRIGRSVRFSVDQLEDFVNRRLHDDR